MMLSLSGNERLHNRPGICPAPASRFIVGVDLGQAIDPTAVAVVEKITEGTGAWDAASNRAIMRTLYDVRHLERLPLRTGYPDVVAHVGRLMSTPPLAGNCELVIDQTGVGRPIFDMFRRGGLKPKGITITAGDGWKRDGDSFRVAKLLLVSQLQAMLHCGALRIARSLPEAAALVEELKSFRASHTEAGNPIFGARVGQHDDLVLAVAIGAWHASLPVLSATTTSLRL